MIVIRCNFFEILIIFHQYIDIALFANLLLKDLLNPTNLYVIVNMFETFKFLFNLEIIILIDANWY